MCLIFASVCARTLAAGSSVWHKAHRQVIEVIKVEEEWRKGPE